MKTSPVYFRCGQGKYGKSRRGAALILVLGFVVLLVGLVVAFLSRSLFDRKLADSSSSQTQVDLFTQGAVDTILADLKQEIVAGSKATAITTGTVTSTIYTPTLPATMIPCRVNTLVPGTDDKMPTLLKRSVSGQAFFSGTNYTATGPKRAAAVSTGTASLNDRTISRARWNKPLLLPKADLTKSDPTPLPEFTVPDWILVGRDGSQPNPTTFGDTLKIGGTNAVLGRYAYTIYDEGSTLDLNVAGCPVDGAAKPLSTIAPYKNALAYADLTQLPGLASLAPSAQAQVINAIVGWRNQASGQPNGTFPGYTFTAPAAGTLSSFDNYTLSNSSGFLKISGAPLYKNQSDQAFTSRQQLIRFLQNLGVNIPAFTPALQQQLLTCLGTFTRDLNQPSFIRPQSTNKAATFDYDPNVPAVLPGAQGGNNAATFDDLINPSFLRIRVANAFTRNDGTRAVVGEPLVKKRFALSRLAWITWEGPSHDASATTKAVLLKAGITQAVIDQGTKENIQKYFGLTWQPDTNTATGVDGVADGQSKWFYNYHNSGGAPAPGSKGAIMTLGNIAAPGMHEPDFFELLKAGINVGSIGKSSRTATNINTPERYQYNRDTDVDAQIIQIGANIIDQFDMDGYPTQIVFDNGGGPVAFYGVENLPYIYRVRNTYWKVRLSVPDTSGYYSGGSFKGRGFFISSSGTGIAGVLNIGPNASYNGPGTANPSPLTDTGIVYMMSIPDLWNPHDLNATRGTLDSGNNPLFPTSFRVVAQSAPPGGGLQPFSYRGYTDRVGDLLFSNNKIATGVPFPVYKTDGKNGWNLHARNVTTQNSGMYFTLNNNSASTGLFREPTMLYQVGFPTGSGLTGIDPSGKGGKNAILTTSSTDGDLTPYSSSGGVKVVLTSADPANPNGFGYNKNVVPKDGGIYLGIYLGAIPLASLVSDAVKNEVDAKGNPAGTNGADWVSGSGCNGTGQSVTYMMQCLVNGNWVTYDMKYTPSSPGTGDIVYKLCQSGSEYPHGSISSREDGHTYRFTDPRTARFGTLDSNTSEYEVPPWNSAYPDSTQAWSSFLGVKSGMLDPVNGVVCSDRPDMEDGRSALKNPAIPTTFFEPAGGGYTADSKNANYVHPGLFAQNRSDVFYGGKAVSTDPAVVVSPLLGHFYTDADGVLRRAMGAYVKPDPAKRPAVTTTGLPLTTAGTITNGSQTATAQSQSRPFILNRPFRSVTELGYTFSGTPWKNVDFFTPESGQSALLDVFCLNDTDNSRSLVAGKVNLNTRQTSTLQAVLSGGYKDEARSFNPAVTGAIPGLTTADTQSVAAALVQRTALTGMTKSNTASAPLTNLAGLVGQWSSRQTITSATSPAVDNSRVVPPHNIDGSKSYDGLSKDLDNITFSADALASTNIQRFRESALRPLANCGTTRVWNLMIDVVAQTGRYPGSATGLNNFLVEGEQRYWIHLAMDRYTGQVLDQQIEVVKE